MKNGKNLQKPLYHWLFRKKIFFLNDVLLYKMRNQKFLKLPLFSM